MLSKDYMEGNSMLKVENLTKKFKKITAVENVSFEVNPGEIVGLLGENGAGKTTTLRMIATLLIILIKSGAILESYSVAMLLYMID